MWLLFWRVLVWRNWSFFGGVYSHWWVVWRDRISCIIYSFIILGIILIIFCYIISFIHSNNFRIGFVYRGFILNSRIIIYWSIINACIVYCLIINFYCRINLLLIYECKIINWKIIFRSVITNGFINEQTILFIYLIDTNIKFIKLLFVNLQIILFILFI